MKININFDWAVLTSIFTMFLYWCGYCYYIGYLSFYHHNLDAFDIPVASTVIQGMLTGYKAWCPLVAILIIFSYISSISKKQWLYWIVRGIGLTVNLLIIIYSLSLYYLVNYLWTATTLLDKYRLFFLHRREHYEWTTLYPRI